jgi:hypothetical protein
MLAGRLRPSRPQQAQLLLALERADPDFFWSVLGPRFTASRHSLLLTSMTFSARLAFVDYVLAGAHTKKPIIKIVKQYFPDPIIPDPVPVYIIKLHMIEPYTHLALFDLQLQCIRPGRAITSHSVNAMMLLRGSDLMLGVVCIRADSYPCPELFEGWSQTVIVSALLSPIPFVS